MTTEQTTSIPTVDLNDGRSIPQLGFGVFQVSEEDTAPSVRCALQTGYRSIDTAAAYGNEAEVGEAIRQSGLDRDEVFLTTKLWNDDQGYDAAFRAFEHSLERLGFDQVDLYLIHWPAPGRGQYVETWRALCELKRDGRARSIGVSNFTVENLERVIDDSGVVPALNQIELHPRLIQSELRRFHSEHGIATEAWSPLAQGAAFKEPAVAQVAVKHGRTLAQVILRWHLQSGTIVIPKSQNPERMKENMMIFDFALDQTDMAAIAGLDDPKGSIGPDPNTFQGRSAVQAMIDTYGD